jgi:hypothetical protein
MKNTNTNKLDSLPQLNPQFITGFSDAEACFHISLRRYPKMILGWGVSAIFSIDLHVKDLPLLYGIQN